MRPIWTWYFSTTTTMSVRPRPTPSWRKKFRAGYRCEPVPALCLTLICGCGPMAVPACWSQPSTRLPTTSANRPGFGSIKR